MPDYLYSADDQDTAILAIEALIVVTSTDARLQTAYRTWGRGIQDVFEAQRQSHPDVAAGEILLAAMHRDVNGDRDCIAGVIEDELLLPYPWLADMLLVVFQTRLLEEATASNCFDLRFDKPPITIGARLPGETARQFARRVAAADAPPAGRRRPKGGGAHILRDVAWFYRVNVRKGPEDTVSAMAREYMSVSDQNISSARSVVQFGIKRAKGILSGIAAVPFPTAPKGRAIYMTRRRNPLPR